MYHSITIGEKNTWDDWHLIPESRPLLNPPSVKYNFIDIPGQDGMLDLTTAMTGKPLYNNRSGSWTFYVENDFRDWAVLYSQISVYLQGQKFTCKLEDDPEFFYEGRFSVNQWLSDAYWSRIVIDYNVGPYKRYVLGEDRWLWDTFNFTTDQIWHYSDLVVVDQLIVNVHGDLMDAIPVFVINSDDMFLTILPEGTVRKLQRGANRFEDIVVHHGDNYMGFTGHGTISIVVESGRL